jgi:hypothetical protein
VLAAIAVLPLVSRALGHPENPPAGIPSVAVHQRQQMMVSRGLYAKRAVPNKAHLAG